MRNFLSITAAISMASVTALGAPSASGKGHETYLSGARCTYAEAPPLKQMPLERLTVGGKIAIATDLFLKADGYGARAGLGASCWIQSDKIRDQLLPAGSVYDVVLAYYLNNGGINDSTAYQINLRKGSTILKINCILISHSSTVGQFTDSMAGQISIVDLGQPLID